MAISHSVQRAALLALLAAGAGVPLSSRTEAQQATFQRPLRVLGLDEPLYRIRDVALLDDRLYVLTAPAPAVHVFRIAGGREYRAFGREGPGPGELRNPLAIVAGADVVQVLDMARSSRVVEFSPTGSVLASRSIDGIPLVVRIARAGANIIGEAAPFGSTHRSLFRLDQPRRPIIEFEIPAPIQVISDQGPMRRLWVGPPFAPRPQWTITTNGEIAFWPGTGTYIRLLAVSGQPTGSLALPPERIAVHTADRRVWLQNTFPPGETLFGMQDAYRGLHAAAERSVSFPPHFPPVLRLLPDPAGGVWVLRAQRADGEIWTLLRQGRQPRSIAGPGERAIVAFGRDVIVMQTRSRDDVEIIELYARPQLQ